MKGKAKVSANWVELIHKISFDTFCCPNCDKEMEIIAFFTDNYKIKKILQHIVEQN